VIVRYDQDYYIDATRESEKGNEGRETSHIKTSDLEGKREIAVSRRVEYSRTRVSVDKYIVRERGKVVKKKKGGSRN